MKFKILDTARVSIVTANLAGQLVVLAGDVAPSPNVPVADGVNVYLIGVSGRDVWQKINLSTGTCDRVLKSDLFVKVALVQVNMTFMPETRAADAPWLMVYNSRGGQTPAKKHLTSESAVWEAERLAGLAPGSESVILKPVRRVWTSLQTTWSDI